MQEIIEKIAAIAKKKRQKVYIVGGFLRDSIMGKDTPDIDFVVFGDAMKFAETVAIKLKGSFINLSKKFGFFRVVIKKENRIIRLDFAKSRGKTLSGDLNWRDFIINTLLARVGSPDEIIDKFGAIKDLDRKVIREVNNSIFKYDPLRILRAIRFSSDLKFRLSNNLKKLIKKDRFLLKRVSGERIRDELFKILEYDDCTGYIKLMDKLKIMEVLFPGIVPMKRIKQSDNHHLDVWNHSIETVRLINDSIAIIEKLNKSLKDNIRKYVSEEITKGRGRTEVIKFAALFHDIAKPEVRKIIDGKVRFLRHESVGSKIIAKIGREFKLSKKEIKLLKILVLSHLRPGNLVHGEKITKRAVSRFIADLGNDVFGTVIISLADRLAARGKVVDSKIIERHIEIIKIILDSYQENLIISNLPKLISGHDLMDKFCLTPGPLIGKILNEVKKAQIAGKISTFSEAMRFAELLIRKKRGFK